MTITVQPVNHWPPPHLNMIGNQPAIPFHCNGKLVISTGWLAGHEVQFEDATESQEKKKNTVSVLPKPGSTDGDMWTTKHLAIDLQMNKVGTACKETECA